MIPALPAVAAFAAGVQVGTLRQWVRRGKISPPVDGCYDLEEILTWSDEREGSDRARQALAARRRRGESRCLQNRKDRVS